MSPPKVSQSTHSSDVNPFRFGWRYIKAQGPKGQDTLQQVPLTLEDVLHPKEGDVIPENTVQERDRRYLHNVLEQRFADRSDVLTLSDCLIDWGLKGLKGHSPDISAFEDVRNKEGTWGIYHVAQEGGTPLFVAEIVSPHTRVNDVTIKVKHYHRAGVPWYLVVDQEVEHGSRALLLYRWSLKTYRLVKPDDLGRVRIPGDVMVGLESDRLICFDALSGEELGDYTRVCHQLEEEIAGRREAEEKASEQSQKRREAEEAAARARKLARGQREKARRETEARRLAEQQMQVEAEARRQAEEQARTAADHAQFEAEARRRAEERVRTEEEARRTAEDRVRSEEEARIRVEAERLALEQRIRHLEEQLRQKSDLPGTNVT